MSYNYEKIIQNLDSNKIINLMTKLGADRYVEKDDFIIFPTICHNTISEEASMKLYYYKNNNFFYCYTEDGGMSVFKFLETYYKTRNYDYNWFTDIYEVINNCSNFSFDENFYSIPIINLREKIEKRRQEIKLEKYDENILKVFSKNYPVEWLEDNITKESMDKYNILYSISQNKIIIPHYDVNGNLVGIRGRALNLWEIENIGKYAPVQIEGKWYNHKLSFNLYGLHQNLKNIIKNKYVLIFEGEKSILQCESFNQDNCAVAVCGSNFNKYQLNLLLKYCYPKEIIICFDKEEKNNEKKYFQKLWNIGEKYNKYCDFSFIYDRENLLNLKDSPSDKGEEIFNKLLRKRVQVK